MSKSHFYKIEPCDEIMLSTFKQFEDKKGYVLRVWNTTNRQQTVKISTVFDIASASILKLDETPVEEITVKEGVLSFEMLPHKLATIKIIIGNNF